MPTVKESESVGGLIDVATISGGTDTSVTPALWEVS